MADSLLMLNVYFKVTYQNKAAVSPDALFATTKLARFHVPFHDVDPILLIKGHAGHLVEGL